MNTLWKIIKLGGTSQCLQGYLNIERIIKNRKLNEKYVFVLSAVSGITNLLEKFTNTKDDLHIEEVIKKNDKFVADLSLKNTNNYDKIKLEFLKDCKNYKTTHDDIYFQSKIIGYGEVFSTHILKDWLENLKLNDIQLLNSYEFIFSKKETFKLYPLG